MKKLIGFSILLIALVAFSFKNDGYDIGDKAMDFSLKNVNGEMVSMDDYDEAKGFMIIFTCNSCPYSVAYEDRIIALHEKYADKGVPVIAINPNDDEKSPKDSFKKMIVRAKEKGFPFPYVYDETQEITRAYGATNTPHVYVLDADRTVKYIGAIDNNTKSAEKADKKYVEDAVDAVLNGKEVLERKTKAIGCTIKWAS
ncbi:thioredoxin family protein [Marivirga tractuosa]|uniref:Alkyl hydroperoxide reductase/ Thiol specific antioxidant/ Mal allergen n=1 Tax=Marivirga tractuosa (strain ATCC 23168 / DSM 4126 / NBRC 15989 / NCIMB 1408 / VKM B-1430 / H-43) TaxID=643867 RepID=E4TN03_MARTH|nr:thioredoxin family protein [Marivirga tractuosa]ADR21434.1 alkyl hydroperoxide reductase/ Thiol specific antioxidant/ Mal allergen [Marivirga tractuosa DSM 4126]BDD14112.1 thioredoxin family protein [Marivirga tractuosa]